ncbi:MAG TPA: 2,3-bisphosphoglycerate-dependent phosphoglycerate mutase [Arthrobacter sp.]
MPAPGTLVLLRHGQSTLNAQDRFTGLLDPRLSPAGNDEAAFAGALLASSSFSPDAVYTSTLRRTRDTARIVLDVLGDPEAAVLSAWELNERSYGSLTGRARGELLSELGPEVFRFWRRSYYGAPPPMSRAELGAIRRSRAFAGCLRKRSRPPNPCAGWSSAFGFSGTSTCGQGSGRARMCS